MLSWYLVSRAISRKESKTNAGGVGILYKRSEQLKSELHTELGNKRLPVVKEIC